MVWQLVANARLTACAINSSSWLINCHDHHDDHLDSKSGGFLQSDTHLPHPVVIFCPDFNFLWWESIPFNQLDLSASTPTNFLWWQHIPVKIHSILVPIYHTPTKKSKVVESCFLQNPHFSLSPHVTKLTQKPSIVQFPFLAIHAHRVRKNNDTWPTPRHKRFIKPFSDEMFGRPAVISTPVIVWLLDLLQPWSAQLREKRKRKATHCGSEYRRTLSRTRPPPTRNEPAPKSPFEAALCIYFRRRRLPRPLLYSTMKQHPRDPARQCLWIDRWGDGTYEGEEDLYDSGPKAQQCHSQAGPHHLGVFRVYLPPAWLASWSNHCQPNYEDSLKNPSQPPVLYVSSIYSDHLAPKPRSDVRVDEIGSS